MNGGVNRSLDVTDIVGSVKIGRGGHKLYNDPTQVGVYAGGRKGFSLDQNGNYKAPSKNEATVFSHLEGIDYAQYLRKPRQQEYYISQVKKNAMKGVERNEPQSMVIAGVKAHRDALAMQQSMNYVVPEGGSPKRNLPTNPQNAGGLHD